RVAGLLAARGIRPGDRVAIMLPNVPEFAALYFGVLRAGGVVVPMNPLLKAREVSYYLGDSGARLIFAWHGYADEARTGARTTVTGVECLVVDSMFEESTFKELLTAPPVTGAVVRSESDTAVILYTSGTTGQPKGAELTHANLATNAAVAAKDLFQLAPD